MLARRAVCRPAWIRLTSGLLLVICFPLATLHAADHGNPGITTTAAHAGKPVLWQKTGASVTPDQPMHNPPLAEGVLLIAGENLSDPNFSRSVVLITDYSETGTVGLVINRRTKIPAAEFLPNIRKLVPLLDHLYIGGPVAPNQINLLVKSGAPLAGGIEMTAGVYLINTIEHFNTLSLGDLAPENIRLYSGFAGWAPGQLESELIRGDWFIWHASSAYLFSHEPEKLWQELIQIVSARWVLLTGFRALGRL